MKIGQILWMLNKATNSVSPVRVTEKTTKETAQGTVTTFTVESVDGTTGILSQAHTYFENIDDVRAHLQANAQKLIDTVIERAQQRAAKFVAEQHTVPVQNAESDDTMFMDVEEAMVTLPDGRVAKAKIRGVTA